MDLNSKYIIYAKLDPKSRTLTYTEQVQIQNSGSDSTSVLYFHLYGNKYKTADSDIEIITVADENGTELPYQMKDQDQLIKVRLNDALDAGKETVIEFSCEATIPDMLDIYGIDKYGEIQMPLFYPQLAVYDKDGWSTLPMNDVGDGRCADISDYELTIQTDSEYQIAYNGMEVSCETSDGETTYIFQAEDRRDLVFTACKDYVRLDRTVGDTESIGCFNQSADGKSANTMEQIMDAAAFALE